MREVGEFEIQLVDKQCADVGSKQGKTPGSYRLLVPC